MNVKINEIAFLISLSYPFSSLQAEKLMHEIYVRDAGNRNQLLSLFTDLEPLLTEVMEDSGLRKQLEREDVIHVNDYKATVEKLKSSLSEKHCPIVLAGRYTASSSS